MAYVRKTTANTPAMREAAYSISRPAEHAWLKQNLGFFPEFFASKWLIGPGMVSYYFGGAKVTSTIVAVEKSVTPTGLGRAVITTQLGHRIVVLPFTAWREKPKA
jgi:hypothetical protein